MGFRFFLLSVATFVLAACSGGSSSGEDARAQQQRDSKVLEELFTGVQGTWTGTVSNPASGLSDFDADLKVYIYYVQDGSNPDGSAKLRPTLRGRFQPKNFVSDTDMITLGGDYDRNGRLNMTAISVVTTGGTASSSGMTITPKTLSALGSVVQGNMQIDIVHEGGFWGRFTANRTSTISAAPVAGEQNEYRERFMRINGPLEGRYTGRVKTTNGNDYYAEFSMVIIERPLESGGSAPLMMAQYRRLDMPPGTIEWALVVDYNAHTSEVLMKNDAALGGGGTGFPGGGTLSVSGTLKTVGGDKVLNVTIRNRSAVIGTVEATLQSGSGGGRLPFL